VFVPLDSDDRNADFTMSPLLTTMPNMGLSKEINIDPNLDTPIDDKEDISPTVKSKKEKSESKKKRKSSKLFVEKDKPEDEDDDKLHKKHSKSKSHKSKSKKTKANGIS